MTRELTLEDMRQKWAGDWTIWRSRRTEDDLDGARSGEYLATRLNPEAGRDRTVMVRTLEELDEELEDQQARQAII